jgi:hypothetical protein
MASNNCPTTSLPCVKIDGTVPQTMQTQTGAISQAQPITYSLVYIYDGRDGEAFSHFGTFININTGAVKVRAGNNPSGVTAANGSWHAVQGVINTTSSAVFIDGSSTTGISAGSNNANTDDVLRVFGCRHRRGCACSACALYRVVLATAVAVARVLRAPNERTVDLHS